MGKAAKSTLLPGRRVMDAWRADLLSGKPPVLYKVGEGCLKKVEWGPGRVSMIGGAPGGGKTGLVMQMAVDAARAHEDLRVCVCNVEMHPTVLLERQLARISGIDLSDIMHRRLTDDHKDRIEVGLATLDAVMDRLAFVGPPFDMSNIVAAADAFGGVGLLVLDYVQRIGVPGAHESKRASVGVLMENVRSVADQGVGVVAVSSVGRTRDSKGRSSYVGEGLSLASFKESGDLEYGADDAYILVPDKDDDDQVILKHLKARHGQPTDLTLRFDRPRQRFSDPELAADRPAAKKASQNAPDTAAQLDAMWAKAAAKPGKGKKK